MKKRKVLRSIAVIAICIGLVMVSLYIYSKYQMRKIPELSFQEALEYTMKGNEEAIITVGIIENDKASYRVYGENGKELSSELHTYEIGSLTKTFTAAMISKAIEEGLIGINNTIDEYLSLSKGNSYPTIKELLTHTSGYKPYYFESQMISNFLKGRNDFYGITKKMILDKASDIDLPNEEYSFNYSNYGYAMLGLVLEEVYEEDYTALMNQYLQDDLQLPNTEISNKDGDLNNYWDWKDNDAYLPAGAITSDILDMLAYAQMQMDQEKYFSQCHESIKEISESTVQNKMMNINMDAIGMAWLIDKENNIIWHNGGTDDYNSYMGFSPERGVAVVILSNLSPNYRIPATVIGIKLLKALN
ncbi:serine hydrolase domain-containing protein [Alloiococcus sp. CFN-8]|uniref:serine hydrolase domain-containing protein n=1 Tax=Alloiococcus sp. CFN-8 TaxID=3416081 RepID=UPI003CED8A7D